MTGDLHNEARRHKTTHRVNQTIKQEINHHTIPYHTIPCIQSQLARLNGQARGGARGQPVDHSHRGLYEWAKGQVPDCRVPSLPKDRDHTWLRRGGRSHTAQRIEEGARDGKYRTTAGRPLVVVVVVLVAGRGGEAREETEERGDRGREEERDKGKGEGGGAAHPLGAE